MFRENVAHGNGPNGLTVVQAALVALSLLDLEHAAVYFQIIWNGLREPVRKALEVLVMERQIEGKLTLEAAMHEFLERIKLASIRKGEFEGELKGKRDALLRLLARAGIAITEDESARIQACTDTATLDRWLENILGAKTATDVLS